ncbi:spermatogenesis-associated protein 6 isoform X2 [Hyperolius riggenbachi]|uniref:spermatogenesis-associated protein 6 isoform X2 n=1 Tax=Hyperolius riggenbachi TaxID=752182 RepID=UPI0035A2BD89
MRKQFSSPVPENASFRMSRSYEQPTIASKSRSPSPYTNRRMCQLSEDSKQRLSHLHLGPFQFKKETEVKPPFIVRHVELSQSADASMLSCSGRSLRPQDCSGAHGSLSLDSVRPSRDSRRMHVDELQMSLDSLNDPAPLEVDYGTASPYGGSASRSVPLYVHRHPPSPVLSRSSLRERFQSDHQASVNWEEIHSRVRSILRTHSAQQKLNFDKTDPWEEPHSRSNGSRVSPVIGELHSSLPYTQDKSVHLDNGEFWSNRASEYQGKSHRLIFEESMGKIYKNMYRNASDPHAYRRSHKS